MHGQGTLTWPDGKVYRGQLRQNQKHGQGRLEAPAERHNAGGGEGKGAPKGMDVFEGQWRADR